MFSVGVVFIYLFYLQLFGAGRGPVLFIIVTLGPDTSRYTELFCLTKSVWALVTHPFDHHLHLRYGYTVEQFPFCLCCKVRVVVRVKLTLVSEPEAVAAQLLNMLKASFPVVFRIHLRCAQPLPLTSVF